MTRFTSDNTEGYSTAQITALNKIFNLRIVRLYNDGVDTTEESLRDHVAEQVLADFDASHLVA